MRPLPVCWITTRERVLITTVGGRGLDGAGTVDVLVGGVVVVVGGVVFPVPATV